MKTITQATDQINELIKQYATTSINEPISLYSPMYYILNIGGKRLRPAMVLATTSFCGTAMEEAHEAALAVEIFHNFSLVHDDIMDAAPIRRTFPTVHEQYNTNQAVLSGDVMLIKAYEHILSYEGDVCRQILEVFTKMAREVCEGQQLDMDFEKLDAVTLTDYITMITYKTSVLLAACLQIGAIIAKKDVHVQRALYQFGKNIGIAFQIQDDILDTYGQPEQVGKQVGGDILQNKKTFLYLKAIELADPKLMNSLSSLYASDYQGTNEEKIAAVKKIFNTLVVKEYAIQVMEAYRDLALSHLKEAGLSDEANEELTAFADYLILRSL